MPGRALGQPVWEAPVHRLGAREWVEFHRIGVNLNQFARALSSLASEPAGTLAAVAPVGEVATDLLGGEGLIDDPEDQRGALVRRGWLHHPQDRDSHARVPRGFEPGGRANQRGLDPRRAPNPARVRDQTRRAADDHRHRRIDGASRLERRLDTERRQRDGPGCARHLRDLGRCRAGHDADPRRAALRSTPSDPQVCKP